MVSKSAMMVRAATQTRLFRAFERQGDIRFNKASGKSCANRFAVRQCSKRLAIDLMLEKNGANKRTIDVRNWRMRTHELRRHIRTQVGHAELCQSKITDPSQLIERLEYISAFRERLD